MTFFYQKIIFKPKQLTQLHEGQMAYLKKKKKKVAAVVIWM